MCENEPALTSSFLWRRDFFFFPSLTLFRMSLYIHTTCFYLPGGLQTYMHDGDGTGYITCSICISCVGLVFRFDPDHSKHTCFGSSCWCSAPGSQTPVRQPAVRDSHHHCRLSARFFLSCRTFIYVDQVTFSSSFCGRRAVFITTITTTLAPLLWSPDHSFLLR